MWGDPGVAYVYLVYGMYDCLNVVTEPVGRPAAVLIRAVEPIEGIDTMREARVRFATRRRDAGAIATERTRIAALPAARVAAGPGLVAAAFELTRADTGRDLCDPDSPVRLEPAGADIAPVAVAATPRIGIDYAGEPWTSAPWRFVDTASPSVSGPRSVRPRR